MEKVFKDKNFDDRNKDALHQTPLSNRSYIIAGRWRYDKNSSLLISENDQKQKLRYKTAKVLEILIKNHMDVVAADCFLDLVWTGKVVSDNVLKQSIKELRQCFGDTHKAIIRTTPKVGYSLTAEIEYASHLSIRSSSESHGKVISFAKKDAQKQVLSNPASSARKISTSVSCCLPLVKKEYVNYMSVFLCGFFVGMVAVGF